MDAQSNVARVAKAYYESYPAHDRETIESLIGEGFHFTSPLDNRIDRQTYFERCWPSNESIAAIDIEDMMTDRDVAVVTYAIRKKDGQRFRNTERMRVKDGQVIDVEVYFGWSIPHEAPPGGYVADIQGTRETRE